MGRSKIAQSVPCYPFHDKDGGPLLPVAGGGLICGKCHTVIASPYFGDLKQAREAHAAAGEKPLELGKRPPADALTVADLTKDERRWMISIHEGRLHNLRSIDGLVALGLITLDTVADRLERKVTAHGRRLAADCATAAALAKATPPTMFDLGPAEQPRKPTHERLKEFRKEAAGSR